MTPFELRFQILNQAMSYAMDKYHSEFNAVEEWNKNNSVKKEYPEFPTYENMEFFANKIRTFVESK